MERLYQTDGLCFLSFDPLEIIEMAMQWILLLLFGLVSVKTEQSPSAREYYLRHPLIFLETNAPPRVYENEIIFLEKCREVSFSLPYHSAILSRGTKVTIAGGKLKDGFESITIQANDNKFELLIAAGSKHIRNKAFALAFSAHPIPETPKHKKLKTQSDVIREMGFPIYRKCTAESEDWFYILEFVPPFSGGSFDGWWIKLKNGRVVDMYGYM
jgi:hypothetical protein